MKKIFLILTTLVWAMTALAQTPEEIIAFAKASSFELSEEELKSLVGGGFWPGDNACPNCGSKAIDKDPGGIHCMDCGYTWH